LDIPPVTVSALQGRRRQQDEQRLLAGESWTEQKLIFTTRLGTPVDTSNILHRFQQILKEAGIEKMRFYDLRHTHASLLIAEGVHPKKIAERLGHASIKLTMDLYGHLFDGSDKESADRMQKLFGGDRPAIKNTALDDVIALPALRKRA
jgi:integrase